LDPTSDKFMEDVAVFTEALVARTGNEKELFFINMSLIWFDATIVHLMTSEKPENRHLITLRNYIICTPDDRKVLFAAMKNNSFHPAVKDAAIAMETMLSTTSRT